jgi:hypothetical protein
VVDEPAVVCIAVFGHKLGFDAELVMTRLSLPLDEARFLWTPLLWLNAHLQVTGNVQRLNGGAVHLRAIKAIKPDDIYDRCRAAIRIGRCAGSHSVFPLRGNSPWVKEPSGAHDDGNVYLFVLFIQAHHDGR